MIITDDYRTICLEVLTGILERKWRRRIREMPREELYRELEKRGFKQAVNGWRRYIMPNMSIHIKEQRGGFYYHMDNH